MTLTSQRPLFCNFWPPQNRHPSTDHQKIITGDYVGDSYSCAKLGAHMSTGGFWAHGWNITEVIFIYTFFEEVTYRSDPSTDFHAWWLKRRGLAQECAFWGFIHTAPHLGGQKTQNAQFWGVNKSFQAKLAKSKNVHIINTNVSNPTKFCTLIKTTECPSWVVLTHASQIQDGGQPPSWKNRKIAISRPRFERCRRNLVRWRSSTLLTAPTVKI